jgi:hydroxyquinol 1,2-dioxygenase
MDGDRRYELVGLADGVEVVQDLPVRQTTPDDRLAAAVASFNGSEDARAREVAQAFVRHLHAFAREVGLTEDEWEAGIRTLIETGRITDEHRNEFVLWSDAPGFETLTTHIFDAASDYLDSDAVFAVKPSLLREFVPRAADDPERPDGVSGEWCSVENDVVLASSE